MTSIAQTAREIDALREQIVELESGNAALLFELAQAHKLGDSVATQYHQLEILYAEAKYDLQRAVALGDVYKAERDTARAKAAYADRRGW